jgi:hypothetical protein
MDLEKRNKRLTILLFMEFGLDKCAVLVLKQGVKVRCEGIVLPDGPRWSDDG